MQAHTNTQKKKILVCGYVHEGKSTVIKYLQPLLKDEYEFVESQVFPPYKAQDVLPRKIAIHSELSQSNDHYHLIVFVMLATSIKRYHAESFHFFVNELFMRRAPVVILLTRGENYLPEGTWLSENTHVYEEVGMKANDIKLVCFAEGGFMEYQYCPLRTNSIREVLGLIKEHSTTTPVLLDQSTNFQSRVLLPPGRNWTNNNPSGQQQNRGHISPLGRRGIQPHNPSRVKRILSRIVLWSSVLMTIWFFRGFLFSSGMKSNTRLSE